MRRTRGQKWREDERGYLATGPSDYLTTGLMGNYPRITFTCLKVDTASSVRLSLASTASTVLVVRLKSNLT